jgi:hypothetical protein
MLTKQKIFLLIVCTTISYASFAQETILPLRYNNILLHQKKQKENSPRVQSLTLPFIDDFSYAGPYPDPNKWIDREAFINTTYPINPPTIGVATLDGLNQFGVPYDTIMQFIYGPADSLTSQPIDMSVHSAADSVYFSFLYEPGGNKLQPAADDSLILEFKNSSGVFQEVWADTGFASNSFHTVIIPIRDASYFFDGFQFRFRNYAYLSGSNDLWHLDYVKLDQHRNFADTILDDIAFQYSPSSILKNYYAMPWNQFVNNQKTETADTFAFVLKNNYTTIRNTTYQAKAFLNGTSFNESNQFSFNFDPMVYEQQTIDSFPVPGNNADSNLLQIHYYVNSQDNNAQNDSAWLNLPFYNYYSYDDGSAEEIYELVSVVGQPGAKFAMHFHANVPDTLQGADINFQRFNHNQNEDLFALTAWSSINPEHQIAQQVFFKPTFIDSINGVYIYRFDTPVVVSGDFYIGFIQEGDSNELGFDLNDDAHANTYLNFGNGWSNSQLKGAVILRPLLGKQIPFAAGIHSISYSQTISVYPNPVNEELHVSVPQGGDYMFSISDVTGKVVATGNMLNREILLSKLPAGMYFLKLTDNYLHSYFSKFIKNNSQ